MGQTTSGLPRASSPAGTLFVSGDAVALLDDVNKASLLTSHFHADVQREGHLTNNLMKNHLASNCLVLRVGSGTSRADYDPFGQPLTSNGPAPPERKDYINEYIEPTIGQQYFLFPVRSHARPLSDTRHLGH